MIGELGLGTSYNYTAQQNWTFFCCMKYFYVCLLIRGCWFRIYPQFFSSSSSFWDTATTCILSLFTSTLVHYTWFTRLLLLRCMFKNNLQARTTSSRSYCTFLRSSLFTICRGWREQTMQKVNKFKTIYIYIYFQKYRLSVSDSVKQA